MPVKVKILKNQAPNYVLEVTESDISNSKLVESSIITEEDKANQDLFGVLTLVHQRKDLGLDNISFIPQEEHDPSDDADQISEAENSSNVNEYLEWDPVSFSEDVNLEGFIPVADDIVANDDIDIVEEQQLSEANSLSSIFDQFISSSNT